MTDLYAGFFRFPVLRYQLSWQVLGLAAGVSAAAAGLGAWMAIRAAVHLPPAEAMRPPAPAHYRLRGFERGRLARMLGTVPMMIVRETLRRPLRSLASALGVGAAVGVMIIGRVNFDSLEYILSDLMLEQQREDLTVSFLRPVPAEALNEVKTIPGVNEAEGMYTVPVRISHGGRHRDIPLQGMLPDARLRRIVTGGGDVVPMPGDGLMLTRKLADLLGITVGQTVELEEKEGERRLWRLPVHRLADEALGLQAYISLPGLYRLRQEQPRLNLLLLRIDPLAREQVERRLHRSPQLSSIDSLPDMVAAMRAQSGRYMSVITAVICILGGCVAVGVVYNNARVALSQRARDLASLRVLGFTRTEVSRVLLGELAVQVLVGLPLGVLLGHAWSRAIIASIDTERLRLPVIIGPVTLSLSMGLAIAAAALSALWVSRRLDRLDLIAVLKTRE
jgi:putative ABC transport system permease protein